MKTTVITQHGIPTIDGHVCTYGSLAIRTAIEELADSYGAFELPSMYTTELVPSAFFGTVSKIIFKPRDITQNGAHKLRKVVEWMNNRPEELNEGKSHLELIREFNNE